MNPARVAHAREWAGIYRGLGYNVLPSDPRPHAEGGRKKPLCRFAGWWESPAPDDLFDRFPTTNIQLMTGRRWNLCVLDLDGAEAVRHVAEVWPKLPRTWTSYHTGGGRSSRHLWFRLPDGLPEKRKTLLWGVREGDGWKPHTAVELLCDRCLVMAPPSVHPVTRNSYGFERGLSPRDMVRPAVLPAWVWQIPSAEVERPQYVTPIQAPSKRPPRWTFSVDSRHLTGLITDKVALAVGWGLRLGRGGSNGWLYCHAVGREDRNPSAQFHAESGLYWEPGRRPIGLFTLGVELGVYSDWRECRDDLASRYIPSVPSRK